MITCPGMRLSVAYTPYTASHSSCGLCFMFQPCAIVVELKNCANSCNSCLMSVCNIFTGPSVLSVELSFPVMMWAIIRTKFRRDIGLFF